ncbi:septal ring lytic transglycosylase RlpA family protein [Bartonella sp. CB175]|uniref:septal ring lytic transglycosylase RlpA family protein n=1 Tax=Bartonella sp. CB175 TaxID=3112256 RepID=UPI00300E0A3B
MLNSTKKIISIINIKSTFQFVSVAAVSQILISCSTINTAHFATKKSDHNKTTNEKTVSLPKKVSNVQNKSKKRVANLQPYQIKGKWYYPKDDPTYKRIGQASWYGSYFHGRLTANGEIYNMNLLTAAHPTMPLPSYARVTNLENGSSIIVRVNDRGPFMKDRIIDLSKQAAIMLGYVNEGLANVKVEYVSAAPAGYYDGAYLMASYTIWNNAQSSLALADLHKKRESSILSKFGANNQNHSAQDIHKQKQLNNIVSVELPEIGPVLVNKPIVFDQVAFMNEANKKIK